MEVPFVDLAGQYHDLRDEMLAAIDSVLSDARVILGREVDEFENRFAEFSGVRHCVSVANGTDALHLALRAMGIGAGDEVITAANTFMATAIAIASAGATPVFVDINSDDFNMDPELLERAITPRTKAIAPVHLYGQPADMDPIRRVAEKRGLKILADTCQSHGAFYHGRPVATLSDAACYSFYPSKNLGAYGDGGAIVTDDSKIAERARLLRNYGQQRKNESQLLGYNSRLDTVQAAILLVKLKHLNAWTEARRSAAAQYSQRLANSGIVTPLEMPGRRHVYHLYVVQHPERDALLEHLKRSGVQAGIHYPTPVPHTKPFEGARTVPEGCPNATRISGRILSLPICPKLTSAQVEHVAESVQSFQAAEAMVA